MDQDKKLKTTAIPPCFFRAPPPEGEFFFRVAGRCADYTKTRMIDKRAQGKKANTVSLSPFLII